MQSEEQARLLDDLEDEVLALGDQVESMLTQSAALLQRPNPKALVHLREKGRQAHQMRLAIEKRGLVLTAAQLPVIGNGRSPTVLMEIVSDLELIVEHALQIGRVDYVVLDRRLGSSMQSIHQLAEMVCRLLHQAVWAVAQRDQIAARTVLSRAAEAASPFETVQRELQDLLHHRPELVSQAIHLSHSVNQLWLATEKVVSICQWVLFEVQGGTDGTSNV